MHLVTRNGFASKNMIVSNFANYRESIPEFSGQLLTINTSCLRANKAIKTQIEPPSIGANQSKLTQLAEIIGSPVLAGERRAGSLKAAAEDADGS